MAVEMLDLDKLKQLHDKAYDSGQQTRDKASDDLMFYWVTQWDDNLLDTSQLQYRGEFNILRKAGRQIMSNIHANPVQVDFEPTSDDPDGADVMDGLYRGSCRSNTSKESFDNGVNEAIVAGVGAWELVNEYKNNNIGEQEQIITRQPLYEACNTVFWDPNAKLLDKSDADYVSVLVPYSPDAYRLLVEELTGEDPGEISGDDFKSPNQSYVFPWWSSDLIYVARFYHRKKTKVKSYTFKDLFGNEVVYSEKQVEGIFDTLVDGGYQVIDEREYEEYEVTRYIASGSEILDETMVPGTELPIVPSYGERAFVEGEEVYEGITRIAKDPQRLRNFQLSYLADIVSRSPRPKPIMLPEQVKGFEDMYEESGADNNYPYLLQNRKTPNGEDLPIGPVAQMPEQNVPNALIQSITLSREAVEDVANPGLPQNLADPDMSGKAVLAVQERMDMQTFIYQSNFKHAMRRDGEVFASMTKEVYDTPRTEMLTMPDGTRKQVQIMEQVMDPETMELMTLNDLSSKTFDVYADVGPSFTSQKQQTREELKDLLSGTSEGTPTHNLLLMKYLGLMDGAGFDDVRDYARNELIMMGVQEPETDEEKQAYAAAQENQQEDPNLLIGQAEMMKGQAALLDKEIDKFNAETNRMKVMIDAKKTGVDITKTKVETFGKQIENAQKIFSPAP
jgi:hypothetical protein